MKKGVILNFILPNIHKKLNITVISKNDDD